MQKLFEFDEHIGDWRVLIQSRDIQNGAIQGRHIAPGAVTTDKIGDGAVKTRHIEDGAITTPKIADGAVTAPKIAPGAVTKEKIADGAIDDIYAVFKDLVENYRPIVINGDVTNAPDEEDITSVDGLLKLKNRSSALNNMGYVILRRNRPFAEQVSLINTIYEIRYDFDLGGETVTIPEGCVLDFQGGMLTNGKLIGVTDIQHMPADLLDSVDCSGLDVASFKKLTKADIMDVVDDYTTDGVFDQRCEQNLKGANRFYSVVGLSEVFCIMHQRQNTYKPFVRLNFYDGNFTYLSNTEWSREIYKYEIPENAVYVYFMLSFVPTDTQYIDDALDGIYFSFLEEDSVLITQDFTKDKLGNKLEYYNVNVNEISRCYIEGARTSPSNGRFYIYNQYDRSSSICIAYSLLKQYNYLIIKANADLLTRVHFLKEEPVVDRQFVEYSDYYSGTNVSVAAGAERCLPIPSDTKYIVIYNAYYDYSTQVLENHKPEYVRLYTTESLNVNNLSVVDSPYVESSVRNANKYSMNIMHWNIGNFSHGGTETSITDNPSETYKGYDAKRTSFVNFFAKYRDYNVFLNEYNAVFAKLAGGDVTTNSLVTNYFIRKIFPRTNETDQLAMYVGLDGLVGYQMRYLASYSGKDSTVQVATGTPPVKHIPKPYVIYRYFLGDTSVYIVHTHLSTYMYAETAEAVFTEMINAVSGLKNVIICGDFNVSDRVLIESVFGGRGYSIANDSTDTWHEWNHTTETPADPADSKILDWCAYRGNFTLSDFEVCTDAVDAGYVDGNVEHMLSDHWPIRFTITLNNTSSMVPAEKGNCKFDPVKNVPLWFTGEDWTAPEMIDAKTITNMNQTFDQGRYKVASGTAMSALGNLSMLPKTLRDNPAGFFMEVVHYGTRAFCFLKPYQGGLMFIGTSNSTKTNWEDWDRYEGVQEKGDATRPHIIAAGNPRPILYDRPWYIGFTLIDGNLGNKPIWWTGTAWVDATGTEV